MAADQYGDRLLAHVRPPDRTNPGPKAIYDMVVVGGGTAGLVCAAAGLLFDLYFAVRR